CRTAGTADRGFLRGPRYTPDGQYLLTALEDVGLGVSSDRTKADRSMEVTEPRDIDGSVRDRRGERNRSGFHPRRVGPRVLERVLRTDVKSTASFESLYVQKRCQPVLFGSLPVDLAQIVI